MSEEGKFQLRIKAFTLSTCGFCRLFKRFMEKHHIPFEYVDIDQLNGEEREAVVQKADEYCPGCGYPIIVVGREVIRGFDEERLREVLRI